jgi:chloramphenicol O-acetyltransferase type A
VRYDTIHVSPTIGREDGTFGFGFFEYHDDIDIFIRNAEKEIERVKKGSGLSVTENTWRPDVIRYSALPWFAFSEMKHVGSIRTGDSVPRISTGKLTQENGLYKLPLSITVHHGLMDGRDVAEFLQKIEYHQHFL